MRAVRLSNYPMLNADQLKERLSPQDDVNYSWRFEFTSGPFKLILISVLAGILFAPALVAGFFWLVGLASKSVAWWMAVVFGALFTFLLVVNFYKSWFEEQRTRRLRARSFFWAAAAMILGSLMYLLAAPASPLASSFHNGEGAPFYQWFLYIVDQLLIVVFLDVPEVFGWNLSSIHYEAWMSQILTILIRFVMTLGIVGLLHQMFEMLRRGVDYYTIDELIEQFAEHPFKSNLVIHQVGKEHVLGEENAIRFRASCLEEAFRPKKAK